MAMARKEWSSIVGICLVAIVTADKIKTLCPSKCICNPYIEESTTSPPFKEQSTTSHPYRINSTKLTVECWHSAVPDNIPESTVSLTLHNLNYQDGLPGQVFRRLHALKSLTIRDSNVKQILNGTFIGLSNLQRLYLNDINMRIIQPDSFSPLHSIILINLSKNRDIGLRCMSMAFYGLRDSGIQYLYLDDTNTNNNQFTLYPTFFRYLEKTPLKYISLSYNQITVAVAGFSRFISKLEYFCVSNNFIVGERTSLIELRFLENLRVIDFGFQRSVRKRRHAFSNAVSSDKERKSTSINIISSDLTASAGFYSSYQKNEGFGFGTAGRYMLDTSNHVLSNDNDKQCDVHFSLPPNLTHVYWQHFSHGPKSLGSVCVTGPNSVKHIDLSDNIITHIDSASIGLTHLEFISFQKCQCHIMPLNAFAYMPSISTVLIGSNYLGNVIESDVNGTMFENNNELKILDIANNGINFVPPLFMKTLTSTQIQILNISNNHLSHLIGLKPLKSLKLMNLSRNVFKSFPSLYRNIFDELAAKSNFTLDLTRNPVTTNQQCCQIKSFIKWTNQTRVRLYKDHTFTCLFSDKYASMHNLTWEILAEQCKSPPVSHILIITVSLAGVLLLLAVVVGTVWYRHRWALRWWIFSGRRFMKLKQEAESGIEYDYDAFVSFNVDDIKWIKENLIEQLETRRGLRLCIHHRDFLPGIPIEENIVDAIRRSRRTLLILTKNFVHSNWCHFEVMMARNRLLEEGIDIIVPVILTRFDIKRSSRTLRNILDQNTYLSWPTEPQGESLFWEKLSDVIRKKSHINTLLET